MFLLSMKVEEVLREELEDTKEVSDYGEVIPEALVEALA